MQNNRKLVPITALVSVTVTTLAHVRENGSLPGMEQWIAWAIVYFILSALADMGLPVAGGFALLIMTTVLILRGESALGYALSRTRERNQRRRGTSSQPSIETQTV